MGMPRSYPRSAAFGGDTAETETVGVFRGSWGGVLSVGRVSVGG